MISYIKCLGKYALFNGRSTRREFWGYTIINFLIIFGLVWIRSKTQLTSGDDDNIMKTLQKVIEYAFIVYILVTICPSFAVMCRRWHDIGRTGKWLWLNLVLGVGTVVSFFFFLGKGDEGTNEYGRDPREKSRKKRR